jgi:hypothetical protein
MSSIDLPVVLTVRGTLIPTSLDAARALHNETAGSPAGIAAARALGDLSHVVYAPCLRSKQSGAAAGELLFLDTWVEARGIMEFFSNAHVQTQAAQMFSAKDATVWMPARAAYAYRLPAARGQEERFVGMVRAPIASPEETLAIFRAVDEKAVRDARRRGLLSHALYIKLGEGQPELLGLDVWSDFDGMTEHYADATHMKGLANAFAGKPATSVWERAAGAWNEW